jgi:hypothetical protein
MDPIKARRVPSKLRETNGEQEGMKRRESKQAKGLFYNAL